MSSSVTLPWVVVTDTAVAGIRCLVLHVRHIHLVLVASQHLVHPFSGFHLPSKGFMQTPPVGIDLPRALDVRTVTPAEYELGNNHGHADRTPVVCRLD